MSELHKPISLQEVKSQRIPISNYYKNRTEKLSPLEKAAIWVTNKIGTFGFFIILVAWTIIWLAWNTLAPDSWRFDPYPAFVLWLFISNMLQLILLPLLMISANLQDKVSQERARVDYEVTLRSERELEVVIQHLEYQNALLEKLVEKK